MSNSFVGLARAADAGVESLIRALSSDDFDTREAAMKKLRDSGDSITPALREARARSADPETRTRLDELLKLWAPGSLAWEFEAGYLFGLPAVVDGRVYVSNKDAHFYCLEAASGKVLWETLVGDLMYPSIAVADNRVYVVRTRKEGRKDGTLFCLNAQSGRVEWTWRGKDSQTFTAPIVSEGRLYLASLDTLFCFDAASGAIHWQCQLPDIILSAPSISEKEQRVFVGNLDRKLYALNSQDGKIAWEFKTGGPVYAGAALADGRAYVGSNDQTLYCLNIGDGVKNWEFAAGGNVSASPAITSGRIFAGCDSGMLYCLSRDGEKIWQVDTGGTIFASPAVTGGKVFSVSINNKLTLACHNVSDGAKLWNFETKEAGYAQPVLAGRRIFVGYHSKFYCLRTDTDGPENWPMNGGNPARTNYNDKAGPR